MPRKVKAGASPPRETTSSGSLPPTSGRSGKSRSGLPFRLTRKNYFSPKRPHLSNSQISDYILSPSYFFKRHVSRSIPDEKPTPSMVRGMLVDALVTGGKMPEKFSDKAMEEADEIAKAVQDTPFFSSRAALEDSFFRQPVLARELDGVPVCGMPDMVVGDTEVIDLKVVSALKLASPAKWMMNALDMGYVRQMAMYGFLLKGMDGMFALSYYHLVAAPVRPGLVKVKAYRIPLDAIFQAFREIRRAIRSIKAKQYDDPPLDDDAIEDLPHYGGGRSDGHESPSEPGEGG